MFEIILVPLDGSKASEIVLPYAEEIAARMGSEMILVSVFESATIETQYLYQYYLDNITERVQRRLESFKAKEGTNVHSQVLWGKPADEILRFAGESSMGLIVIASHGSSGQGQQWPLGTIAAKLLRASGMPVLLIRAPAKKATLGRKRLIKRILVPLDGSKLGESAVASAELLGRTLGAELVLFHVLEPVVMIPDVEAKPATSPDEKERKAAALAYLKAVAGPIKARGLKASAVVAAGSPADQIIDYAEANAVDLIAVSAHGRSGVGRWVFGSVTDKTLHAGDTPVLVVRPPRP